MEVGKWLEIEARIGKLFSNSSTSNRAMLTQKLRQYNLIADRYRTTANASERYTLAILTQERRNIEKQLYPNFLLRMFRRLLIAPVLTSNTARTAVKARELNTDVLKEDLRRMGFSDIFEKVQEKINQGHNQFSIPISIFLDDRIRMDYKVSFAGDGNGGHQIKGFDATLNDQRKPSDNKMQFFEHKRSNGIDAVQAYHLLCGRSLEREGIWCQLDFNDRDEKGNYLLKDYRTGPEYDLMEKLKQLPLKNMDVDEKQKLIGGLKAGERKEVTFVLDGHEKRIYIEANPQFRSLTIYDEHSKKISMNNQGKSHDLSVVYRMANNLEEKPQSKRTGKKIL